MDNSLDRQYSGLRRDPLTTSSTRLYATREKEKTIKLGFCEISLFWGRMLFAFLAITGQVGMSVSLPLWIDSTNERSSGPIMDSYFVLSFSSFSFVVIFGLATLFTRIAWPNDIGETERSFPNRLLFLIGFCNALNGVLIVFSCKGSRTPPYLQAILGNFGIPLTIFFRFIILRKKPTLLKFLSCVAVILGLFICLIPMIFPDIGSHAHHEDQQSPQGISAVLWPLIFMLGFLPLAIMNVLIERGLKMKDRASKKRIHLAYFMFWTSTYQLLVVGLLFWVNILPWFGYTKNIEEFGKKWWLGVQCFAGGAGCNYNTLTRGTVLIVMYILANVSGANVLRYAEGATWLAVVFSLVTPLGFLFWTLFDESPFKWHPQVHARTWFSIGALVIIVPAIFVYNMGAPEVSLRPDDQEGEAIDYSADDQEKNAKEPLLKSVEARNYSV